VEQPEVVVEAVEAVEEEAVADTAVAVMVQT
jgi:hypothetical protein